MTVTIKDIEMIFTTASTSFSPHGLDKGTMAMLSVADIENADGKILDLGCGYGAVGIYAAKIAGAENVIMSDIDAESIKLASQNARTNEVPGITVIASNGFENITEDAFSLILSNPPYHADFSVPKHFIENGFRHLKIGGKMLMVTKRRDWYKNKFIAIFGGVTIHEIDGYFVFCAEKRRPHRAGKNKASKQTIEKQTTNKVSKQTNHKSSTAK